MDETVGDEQIVAWFADFPPLTAAGSARLAEVFMDRGQRERAAKLIRSTWINGNFKASEEREFLERFNSFLTQQHHIARLDRLLWDHRRREAERMLRRVSPEYRALATARLKLMTRASGIDTAIERVPEALREHPGLLYERLRWRRRRGLHERAREVLASPPLNLVRPAAWWVEARIQVRQAMNGGLISEAYDLASNHGQTETLPRAQAEWLAGWIALRFMDAPDTAIRHFEELYRGVGYPISVSRAAYWSGRAAEQAGDLGLAYDWYYRAAAYPTTYYGQLAHFQLHGTDMNRLPDAPRISPTEERVIEHRELTRVARMLAAIGEPGRLAPFLLRLAELSASPGEHRLAAQLAYALGRPDLGVRIARRAALDGVFLIDEAYPVIALPKSLNTGVEAEPALVLAMMRQESGFSAGAISRSGARGLLQLMPATARFVAKMHGLPYNKKRLTTDTEYNLTLGRAYIEGLLKEFDGSYVLAIASYNAGESRVYGWIDEYGDPRTGAVDVIDWVELIPFSETRNYVQRVLETVQVYRWILGEVPRAGGLAADLLRGFERPPT
jgi:soluble lytic murein transglycosylase